MNLSNNNEIEKQNKKKNFKKNIYNKISTSKCFIDQKYK
jgi:hypothetical protein